MKKILQHIIVGLIFLVSCQSNSRFSEFQNGDIIFQSSKSGQSKAIQIATGSKYSHMGIIYKQGNDFFVYEAVQPVKLTSLNDWINKGENAHYVVKRIKNSKTLLTPGTLSKMKQIGEKYAGKDYDLYFEWSDTRIYCSELVWKIYKEALGLEIGKLEKLGDFNLVDNSVKLKLQERYGDNIPVDELVISPASIFKSGKLITVYNN
ncbi:MAG: YiiX family permuted papain-like enzyme [Bacteroidota bacterium]